MLDWEKLNNQRAKLAERSSKSSGVNARFWRPTVGDNRIRVMPAWTNEGPFAGQFWRVVAQHWRVSEDQKGPILCPRETPHLEGACPVCDLVTQLRAEKHDPEALKVAKEIRAKTAYLLNVVDREDSEYTAKDVAEFKQSKPDADVPFAVGDPKVQVYAAPSSVFQQLLDVIHQNEVDITSLTEGHDVVISRTGKGLQTRYSTNIVIKSTEAPEGKLNALDQVGFVMDEDEMLDLLGRGVGANFALSSGGSSKKLASENESTDAADLEAAMKASLG